MMARQATGGGGGGNGMLPSKHQLQQQQQMREAGGGSASSHYRSSSLSSSSSTCTSSPTMSKQHDPADNNGTGDLALADLLDDLRRHRVGYASTDYVTSVTPHQQNGRHTPGAMFSHQNGRSSVTTFGGRDVTTNNYGEPKMNGNSSAAAAARRLAMARARSLDRDAETMSGDEMGMMTSDGEGGGGGGRPTRGMRLVEGIVVGSGKLEGDRVLFALARSRSVDCSSADVYRTTDRECLYALPYGTDGLDLGRDYDPLVANGDGSSPLSSALAPSSAYAMQVQLKQLGARCETLQRDLDRTRRELSCCVGSIRTFWSPELKKARSSKRDEMTRNASLAQQLLTCQEEVQRLRTLLEKLKQEFRSAREEAASAASKRARQQGDAQAWQREKEASERETRTLRRTVDELAARVNQLRDALSERDDTIGKLVTMLNVNGISSSASTARLVDGVLNSNV